MAKRHGLNSRVVLDLIVVGAASFVLNMSKVKVEVSEFGATNKTYVVGLKDLQATFSGFWNDALDKLFDVSDLTTPINVYLYPDAVNAPAQYWWGSAYVDASVTSSVTDAVKVSGTITAADAWIRSGL
jgi:hypothetical protein